MKLTRKVSFLFSFLLLFTLSFSYVSFASEAVEDVAAGAAKDLAKELGEEAGERLSAEAEENLGKLMDKAMDGMPKEVLKDPEALEEVMGKIKGSLKESLGGGKEALEKLSSLGEDGAEDMDKFAQTAKNESVGAVKAGLEKAGVKGEALDNALRGFKADQSAIDALDDTGRIADRAAPKDGAEAEGERGTDVAKEREKLREKYNRDYDKDGDLVDENGRKVRDSEGNTIKEETKMQKFKRISKSFISGAMHTVADQVIMLTFMTIPQIIQQDWQAHEAKKAALQSMTAPLQFGGWVLQMIKSCIDEENPESSLPFYELIPVANVGDSVDAAVSKALKNSVVGGTHYSDDYYTSRYLVTSPQYYNYAPIVVSYPSQSYNPYAAAAFSSSEFGGLAVALNDGLVVDATGTPVTSPPQPPLVEMSAHIPTTPNGKVKSVAHAMPGLLNKLKSASLETSTTSGYIAGTAGGPSVDAGIVDLFDIDSDTGLSLNKSGKGLLDDAIGNYVAPHDFGEFGTVIPMYGWGTDLYEKLINKTTFPHNVPLSFNSAGVVVSDLGNAFSKHQAEKAKDRNKKKTGSTKEVEPEMHFAPPANYSVEGCWVYLCAGTPFAKAVQQGSKDTSVTGPYVDYVIFFDENGNQVPFYAATMAPIVKGSTIKWPRVGKNPDAKYMASLISTGMSEFQMSGQIVAYNENGEGAEIPGLSSTINSVLNGSQSNAGLTAFPKLLTQFNKHRQALVSKYHYGPFKYGNSELTADTAHNLTDGASPAKDVLRVYSGRPCYGSKGKSAVQDVLIALDDGNTTGLPNPKVTNFVSLVTDIEYTVAKDGSLQANTQSAFAHAPGTWNGKAFVKDSSKEADLYWLPTLYNAYKSNNVTIGKQSYAELTDYVKKQRSAWMSTDLVSGVTVDGLTYELASDLDLAIVEKHNCFIYEVSPMPSGAITNKDWYIVTSFGAKDLPTLSALSTSELVNMSTSAKDAKSLVSLVTGNIYDLSGNQMSTGTGRPAQIGTSSTAEAETIGEQLYTYINRVYGDDKGVSEEFDAAYKAALKDYKTLANRVIPVGNFGGLSLAIYAADMAAGNYVYFDAGGMTDPANFTPKELFMSVDTSKKPPFGHEFTEDTPMVLSLISGMLYNSTGPERVLNQSIVDGYVQHNSPYWRPWLRSVLAKLQVAHNAQVKAENNESAALAKSDAGSKEGLTWSPADVKQVISRLRNQPFLPAPYATLKQDPYSQEYVRLAPGSMSNNNVYQYTFFDVPNTFKDGDGKPMQVGAIYSEEGELIFTLKGSMLRAMMHQYGLYGNAKKTIGAPMLQPSLLLNPDDTNLKPGQNGKSMIVSTSDDFPGDQVKMPNGYHLYFSIIMNSYYLMDVKRQQWIDLTAGHLYNMQGHPVPLSQPVAINSSRGAGSDMLLLQKNKAGNWGGIMKNPFKENDYTVWKNYGTGPWKSSVGQAKVSSTKDNKGGTYTVTFENASGTRQHRKTYHTNISYTWEDLFYLPIDANHELLKDIPSQSSPLQEARIIKAKGKVVNFMFEGNIYRVSSSGGEGVYRMVSADAGATKSIEVQLLVDTNTNVPYVKVIVGTGTNAKEYRYSYVYQSENSDNFSALQSTVVQGAIASGCPANMPVGPMVSKVEKGVTVEHPTSRTRNLFVANIPNPNAMQQVDPSDITGLPSEESSEYRVAVSQITSRVYKTADDRYVASLYPSGSQNPGPAISYFNQNGYVDIFNGALFDDNGYSLGTSLLLADWLNVLNTLQVTVNYNKDKKRALFYRSASAVKAQESMLTTTVAQARAAQAKSAIAGGKKLGTTKDSLPPEHIEQEHMLGKDSASRPPKVVGGKAGVLQPRDTNKRMLGTTKDSLPPEHIEQKHMLGTDSASRPPKNNQRMLGTDSASRPPKVVGGKGGVYRGNTAKTQKQQMLGVDGGGVYRGASSAQPKSSQRMLGTDSASRPPRMVGGKGGVYSGANAGALASGSANYALQSAQG